MSYTYAAKCVIMLSELFQNNLTAQAKPRFCASAPNLRIPAPERCELPRLLTSEGKQQVAARAAEPLKIVAIFFSRKKRKFKRNRIRR